MPGRYSPSWRNLWFIGGFTLIQLSFLVDCQTPPNLTHLGCIGPRCYYFSEEPMTWQEANETCRSHNDSYLATIPDNMTRIFLHEKIKMVTTSDEGAWFGAHEVLYDQWIWLNDNNYYQEVHEFHDPMNTIKPFCGVFNARKKTKNIEGSVCHEQKRYLCTKSDVVLRMGTTDDSMFYISDVNSRLPWFAARKDCINRGMDLATEAGNTTIGIFQILKDESYNFWIGLRKSRFIQEENGMGLNYFQFKTGEPNYIAELCLQMTSVGEFNDKKCDEAMPFICEWVNTTAMHIVEQTPQIKEESIDQFAIIVGVAAGGGFFLVIALIVCIILLVKRPKRGGRRHRRRRSMANDLMDDSSMYDTTIRKSHSPSTDRKHNKEVVYDVTSQFNYIKKDPVPLPSNKQTSSRKFGFLYAKSGRKKKNQRLSSVEEEEAQNVYVNAAVQNNSWDNMDMYQNSQAGVPHYR